MNHYNPEKTVNGQREIASKDYPRIGPYDSGDPHVLEYHLLLMKLAGIDGVIVDWYGLTDHLDYAILHRNTFRLLQQCERLRMKFVICYEDQTIPVLVKAGRLAPTDRVSHVVDEISWLGRYWFKSGSYVKYDGSPVLLSFGHSGLTDDEWKMCLSELSSPVAYFSQDFRRECAIGAFGWPAPNVGMRQVDRFLAESTTWAAAIPAAFPRFDDIYRDAGVNDGFPGLPDASGRTFQTTLKKALKANPAIIQIATWNDWGEGTHIEPGITYGFRDLEHLQFVRHHQDDSPNAADLRLPEALLHLRQSVETAEEHQSLDEIAEMICTFDLDAARRKLDSVSGPNHCNSPDLHLPRERPVD
ncbi:MAG: glycoside hydrolase family 99-like domain-containing protein [Planctomycetaceae bacterium]